MTFGNMPLNITEINQLLSFSSTIKNDLPKINQIIKKMASTELQTFDDSVATLLGAARKWEKDQSADNLFFLAARMRSTQTSTQTILSTLTGKMDKTIKHIENRITFTLIFSLILNLLLIGLMFTMILPLLNEIKHAFTPLHDASRNSLEGAQESLSYANQITEAIRQLQQVLNDMVRGITDVATGAQESSLQSSNIINSVKIATELVEDLAQKANQTHDHLNSYQHNLESKIVEIQQFSGEVNKALEVVRNNTDVAEKLASQLTLLDTSVKDISTVLMSVSEITDQTNLLALNASIEAARAGQYGLGFDVVAQRIRDLSDQTKTLTSKITKTVKGIQHVSIDVTDSLKNVINSVRNSAEEVAEVTDEIAKLQEVFHSLYSSNVTIIDSATLQVQSTRRIDLQTQDILNAIQNISVQTENVSAAMQELSASSEEISAQIHVIGNMVDETQNVITKQVKLVELAKATTEKI
jgi:methyl-accepting chemotaxis protein